MTDKVFVPEVRNEARRFYRTLVQTVREYYRDPQHRAEFDKWHLEKYGEPYEWIPENGGNDNEED
nr:MAG TPA: hypothetical protein [Caudoviricetes sp.]